jgi:chromosome segregation protein
MKFKRLELFGFKSFLNRTVFQFNDGITSIVGPNGCGKSNIVDAIVWALGERGTKSLRVKDMGDVIFHGSNGRRPVNIAEVSIELADMDKEYIIKRRIYRDGLNEYSLNGNQVRLKDIQDFLLGTGIGLNSYAIVEQGRIEHFIQMKPYERRVVIEETSGITRFEEKKREAIARLEEVKGNLERVEDIYSEVVNALEKAGIEWDRWKSYKLLVDKNSEIESWILADGHVKLTKRMTKIQERQADLDREITAKENEKNIIKSELDTKEKEFSLTDSILRQLEVDIKGKEKDMESKLLEADYLNKDRKRLEAELTGLINSGKEIETRIGNSGKEIETINAETETIAALLREGEDRAERLSKTIDQLKNARETQEKSVEEERVKLFVTMSTITDIKNSISDIERLAKEKEKREAKRNEERERLTQRLDVLESKQEEFESRLENDKRTKENIKSKEQDVFRLKEELANKIARTKSVIETLKGEKRGKEEFLKQMSSLEDKKKEGPPDTKKLIDMIRVDEGKEKALERFFYREMDYYVLSEGDTKSISEKIKRYNENYVFFPGKGMVRLSDNEVNIDVKWVAGVEDALERIEKGEEGIFLNEDLYIDSRGFILQERAAKKIDIKQFKERKRAEKELKEIEVEFDGHMSSLKAAEAEFNHCNDAYKKIRFELERKEESIKGIEKEMAVLGAEIRTARERLYEMDARIDFSEETSPRAADDLLLEKERHEKTRDTVEGRIKSLKATLDGIRKEHENLSSQWHEASIDNERKRNRIRKLREDVERINLSIANLIEDGRAREQRIEALKNDMVERIKKIEIIEKDYEGLKTTSEKHVKRYEELKALSGNLHMEKSVLEDKIEGIFKEIDRIKGRKENIEKELAVINEKQNAIADRLSTAHGINQPENVKVPQNIDLEKEKEILDKEISDLGEVNFRAEKEYEELKERATFLGKQKEDLEIAMDSLKKTIIKIDNLSKEIFSDTFDTVNNAFKRFTGMLFRGGKGYLALSQDNVGVEMYVQPPGKKVARMELLSGGEKALVSLGLLLALMDTKPSPFSLMDEIDAPLDDANIMSLMEIIQTISDRTQIIFITHNRITMESSHTVYGVTMEDEGISKVVSVRL